MEKPEQFRDPEKKEEQIIEGGIENIVNFEKNPEKFLPSNTKFEEIDSYLGSSGKWKWHLKPEYIKDLELRKKYQEEKDEWEKISGD